jgi:mono/diheme cytochrome c family protein
MNRHFLLTTVSATALALAACNKEPSVPTTASNGGAVSLAETIAKGERLYQEHCAQCHGPEAQGHPDWKIPEALAAPPLNGTGNEWKRSKAEMVALIENGLKRNNEPLHPGWKGRLSPGDIDAIITWYQALWPTDIYERWQKTNATPPAGKKPG